MKHTNIHIVRMYLSLRINASRAEPYPTSDTTGSRDARHKSTMTVSMEPLLHKPYLHASL